MPSSRMTNLARPREEVEQKLKARIEEGERLLSMELDSFKDLHSAAVEYSRWSEFNGELLLRLFTNERLAEEYGGGNLYGVSAEDVGLNEAAFQLYGYIEAETQRLKSILKRTELMAEEISAEAGTSMISDTAAGGVAPDSRVVFVVHGRNMAVRNAMFQFLRAIGLRPREWSQAVADTGKPMPYIGDVLDVAFSKAQAVVVLMTPDDEARLRAHFHTAREPAYETELTPQARPNVFFEAGMAMGRSPERTIIVEVGDLRPFSDIAGRHVIRMNDSSERRQELAQRLRQAGCDVDLVGTDWHREGTFIIDTSAASAPVGEQPRASQNARSHTDAQRADGASLVLMMPPGETSLIIKALRIESGSTIRMSLVPSNGRDAAVIDGLVLGTKRNPLPVAFGNKAFYVRVSEVKHVVEAGGEVWNVELVPDDAGSDMNYDMSGYPSEQVAEMRARRILLDEKLTDITGRYQSGYKLKNQMLENSVAGGGRNFEVRNSPFPNVYADTKGNTDEFLVAARLFAVLELLLTGTVERIHKLELKLQEGEKLAVNFEGQRKAEYAGEPPHIIKVEGVCTLTLS